MKKTILPAVCTLCALSFLHAQNVDTVKGPWHISGFGALQFNQVSFTNWAQGGDNSIAFSIVGLLKADYAQNRHSWNNRADALFGLIRTDEFGLRKNDDKLELESKYGYAVTKNEKLYTTALANFKSQFAPGYNYPNDSVKASEFAAPGYLALGLGIDYKPLSYFSLYISPITGRITFIRNQHIANLGTYGNDPGIAITDTAGNIIGYNPLGKKTRYEFGAYLTVKFEKEVLKNFTLMTKLNLFYDYLNKDPQSRKYIDVDWETNMLFKINEWLSASLILHFIYDYDIKIPDPDDPTDLRDRAQFKEALGIGLTYKFSNDKRQ
ncbi:MAG: hypothetical protein KatS3mg031_0383 [Chitinophagales bacterium]|nr:MAG: hypothetical protein KatS3mg031_0383 [Chitinophagales bacterium]